MARCASCGADLPGSQTCEDRFEELLARDFSGEGEAPAVHTLTVATFLVQHPRSRFAGPEWMGPHRLATLREAMREGADPAEVFRRRHEASREAPRKALPPLQEGPVEGELTIASIDPGAPTGHAERVRAWARSVARRPPTRRSV